MAHNLQALHVKRGLPWDIGKCKPRCIEADGLWDDCLINVANLTKCFQHCYVRRLPPVGLGEAVR